MVIIESIYSREILDSRGNPAVEVEMELEDDTFARASVPPGASTGQFETVELCDEGKSHYLGRGVREIVAAVSETIAPEVISMDSLDQRVIDQAIINLDGTSSRSKLDTDTILGVSLVAARASAAPLDQQLFAYLGSPNAHALPVPVMNILNGGSHADSNVDIQEFMIMPLGAASSKEALRIGAEVCHALKGVLKNKDLATGLGDEGGFAPNLGSNAEAFDLIVGAISKAGYQSGKDIALALDVASSEFFKDGEYQSESGGRDIDLMVKYYEKLIAKYPVVSIEDPLSEEEWEVWKQLTVEIDDKVQLMDNDLFVTNPGRLKRGIDNHVANALLVRVNRIGSLIETLGAVEMVHHAHYHSMTSHRSGETEDATIAHLAVVTSTGQIGTGAPAHTEHVTKYDELPRTEGFFEGAAAYAGRDAFPHFST